ncbi:hypothetical protein RHGRI_018475 [Rhododendron griersonianum]|uniref:Uncharacterized protein n=1 Tax=Rhododendron griersonianum TaxID=479676 RepID=A0AAV6K1U4_9ERIC|nr:hypothetical protein RHGRI_018475 [Rhododendron griersonianum]
MEFSAIPTVLLTSSVSKAPPPVQVAQRRPESVFHLSVWGDYFLAYASADKLDLIDAIQRLGVAYHFETEIEQGLHQIYETYHQSGHKNVNNDEDLYITALSFRLLRQHGYRVSCDVFNKLKDNEGKFKESLIGDVRGLLSLYEATFLSVRQEDILDEAMEFTATRLNSALPNLSNNPIAEQVVHALYQPIHKGLTRLESRRYISFYEKDDSHNKVLLDFAKLDFNLLQKLHQRELSEITRWEAISALDQLPDYMKIVYQKILDTYNTIDDEMAKQGRSYGVEYAKFVFKDLVGAYCKEAKWYHEGYVPSMDEHMALALLSCGHKSLSSIALLGMGCKIPTKNKQTNVSIQ